MTTRHQIIDVTNRPLSTEERMSFPVGTAFAMSRDGVWIAQVLCSGGCLAGSTYEFPTRGEAVRAARRNARRYGWAS